ncbi:MAG: hypothetical protein JWR55_1264, partial [Aeromicrobium sp.]|nr:hypothetical protein [Aeromicrobium sp.]
SLQQAWDGDWHVESVGKVKIESAATTADASTVVACLWTPTTAFLDKSGDSPDGDTAEELKVWSKQTAKLAVRDGRWVITTFAYDGECSGGAPS